jgi:GT2 family glycosyltransferase
VNTLTVVTVNYNSRDYLERCVESVYRETSGPALRLVVVDNASEDRDFRSLQSAYPSLDLIQNEHNLGFATACNQGIRHRPAEFYLLLNPDCEVLDGAVDKCLAFLATRPEIGIVGCRVQNPDGSLQLACRRSIPRPSVALYRLTGLSRLFPRSPRFAAYNLSYLDERAAHEVGAVSGSFLMCRDQVVHDIGGLDEAFFLYGEDLDFC